MHTVSWVSQQLGLTPATLRAWEQRYGIVHPDRTEGGFRLYDDEDVDALRTMSALVAGGMQPAQAAAQIRSRRPATSHTGDGPAGLPAPGALVAASLAYDAPALESILDAAFASAGFEYVVDVWLMAALVEVGHAWTAGKLDIAQEHFISSGVMRRLAAAFDAAGQARGGRHVLTGLAPGATHQIATLAFATMLRRDGLRVTYLGPDLPVTSWVQAACTTHPDAVVVGAPRTADTAVATDIVNALHDAAPETAVYVGGAGATADLRIPGDTLSEAAHWLADTLTTPHFHPHRMS